MEVPGVDELQARPHRGWSVLHRLGGWDRKGAVVDVVALHPFEEVRDRRSGGAVNRGVRQQGRQEQRVALDVEHRLVDQGVARSVVALTEEVHYCDLRPVAMVEHAPLGETGCARRVQKADQVVRTDGGERLGVQWIGGGQRPPTRMRGAATPRSVGEANDHIVIGQPSRPLTHGLERLERSLIEDDEISVGVVQHIVEFGSGERRIHLDGHGADPGDGEPGDRKLDTVRQHQCNVCALANAVAGQSVGHSSDQLIELGVGQFDVVVEEGEGDTVGLGVGHLAKEVADRVGHRSVERC